MCVCSYISPFSLQLTVSADERREHDEHRDWNGRHLRSPLHDEQPYGTSIVASALEHSRYVSAEIIDAISLRPCPAIPLTNDY